MPDTFTDTIDHVTDIADPGERGRSEHLWGDRLMIGIGNIAAWLFPVLMIAIVTQVFIRKAGANQAWLDDAQWWIYGLAMISAFGYAITTDSHVRVDIFHANFSKKRKARIEVFALGWLLLPFLAMMTDILFHYAYSSWRAGEGSDSPNGLHGLYMLKMAMPVLFGAAIVAAFAALYRNLSKLTKPVLWKVILAALPTVWFAAERAIYYILWWFTRFTNPDLHPRRISREPLLNDTVWYGLVFIIALAVLTFLLTRSKPSKA